MNIMEAGQLLAKIQAFDNRNVDDVTILAWQEVLEPHTLPDCLNAVSGYFTTSSAWIMPAHIVERVRSTEQDRVDSFGAGPRLSDHDERHTPAFRPLTQALFRAIRRGELDRATYDRYLGSTTSILDVLDGKAIAQ